MQSLLKPFATWLFRWRGPERGVIVLVQRRIFILPTRAGIGFGLVLVLMLIGSINYGLSLGFVLTFLLASVGITGMLHTFRNIAGLRITPGKTNPVFAGDTARFALSIHNPTRLERYNVVISRERHDSDRVDIGPGRTVIATAQVLAARRGLLQPGRLTLYTRFPVGLYNAWSYIDLDTHCVVYPRPAPPGLPLPPMQAARAGSTGHGRGDDDFAGLRLYYAGDSPRQIAWKAAAREEVLRTKQFSGPAAGELWLALDSVAGRVSLEDKLSQLVRWVLDAHAQGIAYGLKLPRVTIPLGSDQAHRDRCLEALALL